jgi:hypothetical protein
MRLGIFLVQKHLPRLNKPKTSMRINCYIPSDDEIVEDSEPERVIQRAGKLSNIPPVLELSDSDEFSMESPKYLIFH